MKQLWKKFLARYIVQPIYRPPSIQPAAGVNVLRSSVGRYLKYNRPGMIYIIEYDPLYNSAIDYLREDGWNIHLELDASGELFYAVYAYRDSKGITSC